MPAWDEPDWAELAVLDAAIADRRQHLATRPTTAELIRGQVPVAAVAREAANEMTAPGWNPEAVA